MKKLLLLIALLLPLQALAGSATATWTHPTTNTDGSALPLAQITSTRVEWGSCAGAAFGAKAGEVVVPAPAATITINNLPAGTTCFRAFSLANGNESAASSVGVKIIPQPTPNPPTFTAIAVVAGANMAPAYKILADGSRSSVLAGFVPIGRACSGNVVFTYRGASFRKVAAADVMWWATTPTASVAAACG
jgi:hypothetical protein